MRTQLVIMLVLTLVFSAASAVAQNVYITKSGYMAGVTEQAFDKGMDYIVQKDHVALQKLMDAGLVFPLKIGKGYLNRSIRKK